MSHFIWYELMTSDLDAAIDFYGHVVGWTVAKSETADRDYRIIHAGEKPIGGMMVSPDERLKPAFFGYVNVADVDAQAAAFEAAGGATWWAPNDIPGVGRLALVSNFEAAPLYVMTPSGEGTSDAYSPTDGTSPGLMGHCGWNEYHAKDWEKVFDFYADRFGWEKDTAMDMGPMGTYQTFTGDGMRMGGMMNNPLPVQSWLFYFTVGDIDDAATRLTSKGGAVQMGPMQVPGGQWAVVARDAQGAMFGLLGTRA